MVKSYLEYSDWNPSNSYEPYTADINTGVDTNKIVPISTLSYLAKEEWQHRSTGGSWANSTVFTNNYAVIKRLERVRGKVRYELKNFRGDIRQVISDVKYREEVNGVVEYTADVWQVEDSYPFGWSIKDRSFTHPNPEESYRFGFNGKENDKDFGEQLIQDYGFRLYNPAIAKFLSMDPLAPEYPELTTYQFASNTPIAAIDLDGLEGVVIINKYISGELQSTKILTLRAANSTTNMDFQATHEKIGPDALSLNDILIINLGGGANGKDTYAARIGVLPKGYEADEKLIVDAGIDKTLTLQADFVSTKNGILNVSDELGSVGGFTFPGAKPTRQGVNNIVEARIGKYGNRPLIKDIESKNIVPVNQSIGLGFINPIAGANPRASWLGVGGTPITNNAGIVNAVNNAINSLRSSGGNVTITNININRGVDSSDAIDRQNNSGVRAQVVNQRNTLFNNTQNALKAAFPSMGVTITTPTTVGPPTINVTGNRTTTTTTPTVVGSERVLTSP